MNNIDDSEDSAKENVKIGKENLKSFPHGWSNAYLEENEWKLIVI